MRPPAAISWLLTEISAAIGASIRPATVSADLATELPLYRLRQPCLLSRLYSSSGNPYVDAILGNPKWVPSNLTYSFPSRLPAYGASYGDGETAKGFGSFNGSQQAITRRL